VINALNLDLKQYSSKDKQKKFERFKEKQ